MKRKVLVFRLSSLGDVILSTAFLEELAPDVEVTWIVKAAFADVIAGHPRVAKVITLSGKISLLQWIKLLLDLKKEKFEFVADLHSTLRTAVARSLSHFWLPKEARIRTLRKERLRSFFFFLLKDHCPKPMRPRPLRLRVAEVALHLGLTRGGRPNPKAHPRLPQWDGIQEFTKDRTKIAIMPSSKWPGKEWSVDLWVDLCQRLQSPIVVVGAIYDESSVAVLARLKSLGIDVESKLSASPSLASAVEGLKESQVLVTVDTGLGHLAEAIGIPVVVLFGPTHEETGFGPWKKESQSVGSDLWCRPCSKDGTACFRQGDSRFLCMKQITPVQVQRAIERVLS